jgi:hypothetical protein
MCVCVFIFKWFAVVFFMICCFYCDVSVVLLDVDVLNYIEI